MQFFEFITTGFRGSGAPFMFLIVLIGFLALGMIIERVWFLYIKCGMNSNNFMQKLSQLLNSGDYNKAVNFANSHQTPLAKAVSAILQNRGKGFRNVQRAVDEVFLSETPKINRFLALLQAAANMSVLVGLMGTIFGFMEAFDSLANVPAAQRAQALAASIAIVMSSTFWGLVVAVLGLGGFSMMGSKAEKIIEEMDEKSAKLANLVEE